MSVFAIFDSFQSVRWFSIASAARPPLSVVLRRAFAAVPAAWVFENSPAIDGWVHYSEAIQVP